MPDNSGVMSSTHAIGGVVQRLGAEVEHQAVVVERPRGADVDRGADAASGDIGAACLVNLDRADGLSGREIREVE